MLELKNPCEGCEHKPTTNITCTCYRWEQYQARLARDKEVWAYIGEWFYEPLINLYLCDEDTKRKVRELWHSLKKGARL